MKINIITIGGRAPTWVRQGFNEYHKRFSRELEIKMIEIPLIKRHKYSDLFQIIKQEGELIQRMIPKGSHVVALDINGAQWSTLQLADQINNWQHASVTVSLLIGGPDGLDEKCLAKAHQRWSLSHLTLPHMLVRIVVIEAIYRAWTVLKGHPYHR